MKSPSFLPLALGLCSTFLALQHASASPDSVVVFNEVHYNPTGTGEAAEWIEVFNQLGIRADISGWRIDGIGYTFPPNTIINPGAYAVIAKTPGQGQLGPFTGSLSNSGETLRLINQSDRMMDELAFSDSDPWPDAPDGSGYSLAKIAPYTASTPHANWATSAQPGGTPGTANFPDASAPPPVVTTNLLPVAKVWRYNESGADLGPNWHKSPNPVGGSWNSGPGALAYETSAHTVPFGTNLAFPGLNNPYVVTYYFETEFDLATPLASAISALKLRHAIDDGAVFYLNGTEIFRHNMPAGTITAATLATVNAEAPALSASIPVPSAALVPGTNRLSVEVHQFASGNSDVVFGAELDIENFAPVPGAPPALRFNEIPGATDPSYWIELINAGASSIDTTGIIITAANDPLRQFSLPASSLAPGALLLIPGESLGFRPAESEKLFLFSPARAQLLDSRPQTGRLRGRSAERANAWLYPTAPTPGAPNTFSFTNAVVISEIQYNPPVLPAVADRPATYQSTTVIDHGALWRYNAADDSLPADWATFPHPVEGNWKSAPSPLGVESATLPVQLATVLTPYNPATITYYFEREFSVTAAQIAAAESIELTHLVDDGAVFYLNGAELGSRFTMPSGPIGPETLAVPGIADASLVTVLIPTSSLVPGTNRISVEVHQNAIDSNDVVFSLKLALRTLLTPAIPGQPLRSSDNKWVEVANRSTAPVDLSGWDFGSGIDFSFPPGTSLAPGEHACIVQNPTAFAAAYPGARVLGVFSGSLSSTSDRLELRDARRNPVDEVRYFDGGFWPESPDGGGTTLELTDLDADNASPGAWAASNESSRTAWKTYSYRAIAAASNGPDSQWLEFNMGMLGAGEIWIDNVSVIELPATTALQKLNDTSFDSTTAWRLRGNHRRGGIIPEPGNPTNRILRLVATGPTEHMHNQVETTLKNGVVNGREYEISFRARWVSGSSQLHTRLYFNRLARVTQIDRPANGGTPSAPNSTAVTNAGPTFSGLRHAPAVPPVSQPITVSAFASDPDNIASLSLFYSVNDAAFQSVSMSATTSGRYEGVIPGQASGAVIQYYLRGTDSLGAVALWPAAGPASRALCKVNDNTAATNGWHNFRLITTNADRTFMHTTTEVMSNDRIEATVIDREGDIYYNAGVRLKSSQRGRSQTGRVGYNIDFPSDSLYRGAHAGVAVDRSEGQAPGQRELLFDIAISNSGGPISRYNDFIKILAPNSALTGGALLQMARYEDVFLDEQFENGSDGKLYEYELVYYPTSTSTGTATGLKLPQPDNVTGVNITNLGDDKERYRWHFLNKINREQDDFAPIINYCKLFSTSGTAFENALPSRIDLDPWFRGMAYAVATGAGDNAAAGDAHNGIYYAKPDGRIIFFPHDMDFAFDANRSIFANSQVGTLTSAPARRRQYLGHLHDLATTTFTNAYMAQWTSHLASIDPTQDWAAELTYITSRSNSVLTQIRSSIAQVTFAITTPSPLTVNSSSATLNGSGWVNVRNIRIAGSTEFLPVTWTANSTWRVIVPAAPGSRPLTLQALDFNGNLIGTATITINNTSLTEPATAANLVVSEIMYNPPDLSPTEALNGFSDPDQFEFIELMNAGPNPVSLDGVRFTTGLDFNFPSGIVLSPNQRITATRDRAAFLFRYPSASTSLAAGAFLNASGLSNAGESLTLTAADGTTIQSFTYDDSPPWPTAADSLGHSLVLLNPLSRPDHNLPANWRASASQGGSPGASDSIPFTGNPTADSDNDGLSDFMEYALGSNPTSPNLSPITFSTSPDGSIELSFARATAADDAILSIESSQNLSSWDSSTFTIVSESTQPDGSTLVTAKAPGSSPSLFARLKALRR